MQSLLSKELLYPAIKDMAEKFPDWLAQNRQKLEKEDFDRSVQKEKEEEEDTQELPLTA